MPRIYEYVGPQEIRERSHNSPPGVPIYSKQGLLNWFHDHREDLDQANQLVATFVIDLKGELLLAPRQSEHVACAGGAPVRSAGEITLTTKGEVFEISNQSTGYCPEPESWPACQEVFERLSVTHPGHFTQQIIFRRCPACHERNVVKDDWFVCAICGGDLPETWNFSSDGI
ncbi:hypothetical protein DTL21_18540 [Bremerella cremea]|uniref:Uncharacterized protein n=1 Tax=Blastopirellula marina TaxID=124 RepID=A0A2S8FJ83_9BACT|nr:MULTISPECIES: hypothetical protein [Pirellulaceae]PQO32228.1 hypothetical protein C5Y83_18525 [Blastopirellula marina]RCS45294.1 hypothetical protein DTL21_18540 [Bremerella cremea]